MMKSWCIETGALEETLLVKKEKSLEQIINKTLTINTNNAA